MTDDERQAIVDAGYALKQTATTLPLLRGTSAELLAELDACQARLTTLRWAVLAVHGFGRVVIEGVTDGTLTTSQTLTPDELERLRTIMHSGKRHYFTGDES